MIRDSLRLRLLVVAAIAILLALVLAGASTGWFFEHHIERREADALIRDGKLIASSLHLDEKGVPAIESEPSDERYDQAGSGLYWQLTANNGSAHSDSLWDQSLPVSRDASSAGWRIRHVPGPFGKSLLIVERPIVPEHATTPVLIQVATDDEPLREARREFDYELFGSLGLLWLFLLAAAYVQVNLGLKPLAAIRAQLTLLRQNPGARLPPHHPREIAPLAEAINRLADAREIDLGRARKRAGDLAHSLKTPLSALAAQSRRAREAGATVAADGLDHAIAAMRAALETELARTRAAALREPGHTRAADVEDLIENVVAVVERTEYGERLVFEVQIQDSLQIPVAAEDLTELVGALVENAARYAHRRVRIRGNTEKDEAVLWIEDDGPGIGHEASRDVLIRGGRLDEAGPGHGLGLAIVNDLMHATGGRLLLEQAELGGLGASLRWPANAPTPAQSRPRFLRWLIRN